MVQIRIVANTEKGRSGAQQRFPMWCLLHFALVFACFACSEEEKVQTPEGMVLIPAGIFQMGSTTGDVDEAPVHMVELDAFYIDQHEVTNAEYRRSLLLLDTLRHEGSAILLSTNFSSRVTNRGTTRISIIQINPSQR